MTKPRRCWRSCSISRRDGSIAGSDTIGLTRSTAHRAGPPTPPTLLPGAGSDSQWYKNLLKTPAVRLAARGAQYSAIGKPVTDASMFARVLEYFRAKYGAKNVGSLYPHPNVAVEIPLA